MSELGVWAPLWPAEVAAVFEGFEAPWWIAGGWAIDAFLGQQSRDHGDIDVSILRRDQLAVQKWLSSWDLQAADPPGTLRPWLDGETLPQVVTDIWCRPNDQAAWGLQLMFDEADDDEWVYRRSPAVHRPIDTLTWRLDDVPYLAAEVQLFYKAGRISPKNEADFIACEPQLSDAQRRWLTSALALAHPGHPWIERLDARQVDK